MEDQEQDKLSRTTLTALCVSLKIQVSRNLFNNLEVAAHPLPTVPPCQPASLPAAHLQPAAAPSLPDPSGPWHQLAAPTCGSSLHQAADSDLSLSFNFSNFKFKFQLFKLQV